MDTTKTKGNQCLSYTKKSTIVYHLVKKGSPVVSNQKLVHSFLDHFMLPWKRKQHYHPMQMCASWKQMLECNCTNYLTFFLRILFWWFVILDGFLFCHISLVVLDMFELQLVFLIQLNHVRQMRENMQQVMQVKAWIILHEQLSKCPWCIYILAVFVSSQPFAHEEALPLN